MRSDGEIYCDGMPTHYGCPGRTKAARWTKEGVKPNGWLLTHATEDLKDTPSVPLHPLHFCPSCAPIVLGQIQRAINGGGGL